MTADEYLAIEEKAEFKSEYCNGGMFAASGGTWTHNRLSVRLGRHLDEQLDGKPCAVVGSDQRIRVSATSLYTYPDLTIVCGEPRIEKNTLLNPTLIVEVLSPSTEGYYRDRKFDHYRTIESLQEYVIVAQDRILVIVHTRQPDGRWLLKVGTSLDDDSIELVSIGCTIPLGKLYESIQFEAEPAK